MNGTCWMSSCSRCRTWQSGSVQSVWWNGCAHTLDLCSLFDGMDVHTHWICAVWWNGCAHTLDLCSLFDGMDVHTHWICAVCLMEWMCTHTGSVQSIWWNGCAHTLDLCSLMEWMCTHTGPLFKLFPPRQWKSTVPLLEGSGSLIQWLQLDLSPNEVNTVTYLSAKWGQYCHPSLCQVRSILSPISAKWGQYCHPSLCQVRSILSPISAKWGQYWFTLKTTAAALFFSVMVTLLTRLLRWLLTKRMKVF